MRTKLLIGIALFSILLVSAASAACPDGMVGYWRFEEGSGTTAADSSGIGNNGVLKNGASFDLGKVGGAIDLGTYRSGKYVEVANSPSLNPSTITLVTWFKKSLQGTGGVGSGGMGVIAKDGYWSGNARQWNFARDVYEYNPGQVSMTHYIWTSAGFKGAPTVSPGTTNNWNFIAMTYDGSTLKTYFNGVVISNQPLTGSLVAGSDPLRIGSIGAGSQDAEGGMFDEVAMFNRALSDVELQDLYSKSNSGQSYCGAGAPADADQDGVPDAEDNCPNEYNPDQHNADLDSAGDVCDVCPSDANNLCLQSYTDGKNAAPTSSTTLQSVEVQVNIPSGAVSSDTSVSIQRGSVGDFEICTSRTSCFTAYNQTKYSFEPEITFLQPIELKFSYAGAPAATYNKCLNEGCDIFWMNESSNKWVPQKANCSAEPGWCILSTQYGNAVNHFSDYVLGVLEYDYVGNATVTITATDDNSGVANIYYCIDLTDTCVPNLIYTSPLFINTVGTSYVRYQIVDNAGNLASIYSRRISIVAFCDREAPALEIILSGILSGDTYVSSVNWLIRATDALSGMKSLEYNLTQI